VEEPRGLLLYRLDDVRMRVTDVQAADAAGEVEEGVAVDVRHRRAVAFDRHDGQVDRERIRDDLGLPLENGSGPGPRDLGLQADCACRGHLLREY
jgi:hypothetical protein